MTKKPSKGLEDYIMEADSVTLPAWMNYPATDKTVYRILALEDNFAVEGRDISFETIEQAYDYIREELDGSPDLSEFSESMMFTNSGRILLSHTPEDRNRLDRHNYWSFLNRDFEYQSNPDDFHTAYHWVRTHPAFYYRPEGRLNDWVMEEGVEGIGMSVMRDEQSNETKILLEHGGLTDANRVGNLRYADFRLDAWGTTYEDAFIKLAKNINKHFTSEGDDRGIEEEPPSWLKKVIERLEDDDQE